MRARNETQKRATNRDTTDHESPEECVGRGELLLHVVIELEELAAVAGCATLAHKTESTLVPTQPDERRHRSRASQAARHTRHQSNSTHAAPPRVRFLASPWRPCHAARRRWRRASPRRRPRLHSTHKNKKTGEQNELANWRAHEMVAQGCGGGGGTIVQHKQTATTINNAKWPNIKAKAGANR